MANSDPPTHLEEAIRKAGGYRVMTFDELVDGCTPREREQLAWHLAMMRAQKTFEALRKPPHKHS